MKKRMPINRKLILELLFTVNSIKERKMTFCLDYKVGGVLKSRTPLNLNIVWDSKVPPT